MKKKFCIVVANYYPKISKNLIIGASNALKNNGINNFAKIIVPGVFEIPLIIAKNIRKFDAFVALGCVIKGETPHFDFISNSSINGLMNLSITSLKPIGNGILTCLNSKQAIKRSNPKGKNKGGEAVKAILAILKV
tara:strand:+ start:121 stop:528 length:408 start_codon:yes stop_codon:yes gene_type:complete